MSKGMVAIAGPISQSVSYSVVIPVEGWAEYTDDSTASVYLDVALNNSQTSLFPILVIEPATASTAMECGLSTICETRSNVLRVFAAATPSDSIRGTVTLFPSSMR